MKPYLFFVALASVICLGCHKKSSDNQPSAATLIVGTWRHTTDTVNFYQNNILVKDSVISINYSRQFNADGKGTTTSTGNPTVNFSYSISGNLLMIATPGSAILTGPGSYPSSYITYTIRNITSNSLFLSNNEITVTPVTTYLKTQMFYYTKQ